MIDKQIIKDGDNPVAVILDIREYERLLEIEQDAEDYYAALETKLKNEQWISHEQLLKELSL
jgi:hypothetical protein